MFPSMLNHTTLPVLEQAVAFTESRHGVLAGNIANIDTPGYKTRDLSPDLFQDSLRRAIEQRDKRPATEISPGVLTPREESRRLDDFAAVKDSMKHILYHDESDVSLESQVTELAKNQNMHNMAVSLMTQQIRLLEVAISERVA
ncbi:flagellar basal body rod protein FlgB [Aeoliella sp. ICT_H6.2]|uniref:Flagellar basal body rod protein FlgB n=1 Tax=Aeoliella straminimaris TaxID=2954799 RepID=A0A9X2FG12_9BACT|nr:flagellar basal body rod protein FlgB [Aeoliella straminimaris]MCO6047362.1 flagellar basal body rod protein FlgB [Aeoliella straminimaris]